MAKLHTALAQTAQQHVRALSMQELDFEGLLPEEDWVVRASLTCAVLAWLYAAAA